jgi:hypothetical protein
MISRWCLIGASSGIDVVPCGERRGSIDKRCLGSSSACGTGNKMANLGKKGDLYFAGFHYLVASKLVRSPDLHAIGLPA